MTGQGFAGTVQWRHNNFNMNLNNTDLGTSNTELNARGNTFSADAAYTFPLAYNFFARPPSGVRVQHEINNLSPSPWVAPGTWFTFDNLNNTMLRAGLKIGTVYGFNDNLSVLPYVSGNFWHEFDGATTAHFYQMSSAGVSTLPGIYRPASGRSGSSPSASRPSRRSPASPPSSRLICGPARTSRAGA